MLTMMIVFTSILIIAQDEIVNDESVPESEVHAAINPADTSNIIVGAISGFSYGDDSPSSISIYYTLDFGNSWQKSSFHGTPENYVGAGDPVLKFDQNGTAYLTCISADTSGGSFRVHTVMSYSRDKGATWQSIITNSNEYTDKPWLAIDNSIAASYSGYKYVPTVESAEDDLKIILTVLNNTNSILTTTTDAFPNSTGIIHLPCVDVNSSGNVFVSAYKDSPRSLVIAKSSDGGMSFGNYSVITSIQLDQDYDSIIGIPNSRIQCAPYIAIDNSGGTYDGRIYMTYTDYESGSSGGGNTILDTYLTWSDNDGVTWNTPKIINSKAAANTQQYYSNIYVNNQGEILLAWYDRRDDTNHKNTDYYLGISTDGGNTITEIKLTSATTDFNLIGSQNENFGIGEYCQVVATENTAIPFWADGRSNDGDINIYYAKINIANPVTAIPVVSSISNTINITAYPNPVNNYSIISIKVKQTTILKWRIIDINGKELNQSESKTYHPGDTSIKIPFSELPTGTYFIQFSSDSNYINTIIVVKY